MTVRLTSEQHGELEALAAERGVPMTIAAYEIVVRALMRHRSQATH